MRLSYVDTGAIYRTLALYASHMNISADDSIHIATLLDTFEIEFRNNDTEQRVYLAQQDVTLAIRNSEISKAASILSSQEKVRSGLIPLQRTLASILPGAVLEGRDIGTVICPHAQLKIFLIAEPQERAKRRLLQLQQQGHNSLTIEQVRADMISRDKRDRERSLAPLKAADNAKHLDCTSISAARVIETICAWARLARQHISE